MLLQSTPRFTVSKKQATKAAAVVLFALAGIVTLIAGLSPAGRVQPEESLLGIGLTVIALLIMPVLGWLKRKEARRLDNPALAADAVQSAACAYLPAITLIGLDSTPRFTSDGLIQSPRLIAVPLLLKEGREAWHGRSCS